MDHLPTYPIYYKGVYVIFFGFDSDFTEPHFKDHTVTNLSHKTLPHSCISLNTPSLIHPCYCSPQLLLLSLPIYLSIYSLFFLFD